MSEQAKMGLTWASSMQQAQNAPTNNGKYLTGYAAPPQREWVGLTDEDWDIGKRSADFIAGAEWAEQKLKEKNT